MVLTADVIFGVAGQELVFDHAEKRPDSITSVEVFEAWTGDDGVAEGAIDGAPTIEPVQTVLTGAAGRNQADRRVIPVAATDGFEVGRRYHLAGANGDRGLIEILDIDAGVAVFARHNLTGDYAAGDTLESGRVTVALDDAWVADENNIVRSGDPRPSYRARWVMVIDGVTRVHDSYFSLVRYAGDHNVTPLDVIDEYPAFLGDMHEDERDVRGRGIINTAWLRLKSDLAAVDIDDAALRDDEPIDRGVILGAIRLHIENKFLAGGGDPAALDRADDNYKSWLDQFVRVVTRVAVDTAGDGSGTSRPATRLTVR
ncbi:MAG TPA: hypothetical protein VFG83_09155 [Kofleriaceae bacterium]|nr:hypothetical protein [Kofleriaceae bacterium]